MSAGLSTACNADQLAPGCSEGAPDQFHRLDLRGAAGATRVRAAILADGTDFTPVLFLVSATEGGACGEVLYVASNRELGGSAERPWPSIPVAQGVTRGP